MAEWDWEGYADDAEAALAADLSRVMRSIASRYRDQEYVSLSQEDRDRIEAALGNVWGGAMRGQVDAMTEEFRDCGLRLETKDDRTFWQIVRDAFVEQWGAAKVAQIAETTRLQMLRIVREGVTEGLSVDGIGRLMRDAIPDLSALRAHIIARTETHSAAQYAALRTAQTATRPLDKIWNSVEDARTRDFGEGDGEVDTHNHRVMDGVRVGPNDPFLVPTKYGAKEPLMYPGDPAGVAGNVINCRCAMTFKRSGRE